MSNATTNQAVSTNDKELQLFYLSSLFRAVNESCRKMNNVTYSSGSSHGDRVLSDFQSFLCKLAQICDTKRGGDTITALVALRGANGPDYHFASNNRKAPELESTRKFLSDLLDFVGRNPEGLAEKPLKKQVLWRILEFNFPRVDHYLKQIVASVGECIANSDPSATIEVTRLRQIESKATFPRDMQSDTGAKSKFLSDCETLIKTIQSAMATGFSLVMNKGASVDDQEVARAWCELRHHLGRLYSYRLAAESIVEASKEWPELFTGFTVACVPYCRPTRLSLPRPTPSPADVISAAFPDRNIQAYAGYIEQLQEYDLDHHIQERLDQKPVRQIVHCEVHLQDFLVRGRTVAPRDYWNSDMFIATSKPPCRLCHYYFEYAENDFLLQSPHMNVYPKWRLPDIYEGQERDAVARREELLDDIVGQMQQDTLQVVKERHPQWKRNDSRTESWTGLSRYEGRSDTRSSGRFSSMSGQGVGAEGPDLGFPSSALEHDYIAIGSAS